MKSRNILITLCVIAMLLGTTIVFSEPGSEQDPLVTLSYVNKRIDQVKAYIDQKNSGIGNTKSNKLEVVNLTKGQSLIGKAGTEIILRGGKANAIAGELGGLSDITIGKDISMNQAITPNHLLIIPRSDGRGVSAITDAIFLVRGEYEIR